MSQHEHSLSSRRRPSGLIVSFPRASPLVLIHGLRPRPNLFIYALLRRHPSALKDSVNWLEIDFANIVGHSHRAFSCLVRCARSRIYEVNQVRINLIVRRCFRNVWRRIVYVFAQGKTHMQYCIIEFVAQFPASKSYNDEVGNDGTAAWSDPLFITNSP